MTIDPRFHKSSGPCSVHDLAAVSGAKISDNSSGGKMIHSVAPLDVAGPSDLTFFDNVRYRDQYARTLAGACFVRPEFAAAAPPETIALVSDNPYRSYALAAGLLYPENHPPASVDPAARMEKSAQIGAGATIGPYVVIGADVVIGDNVWIEAGAFIGDGVQIGAGCRIGAGASVTHSVIGSNVRIYPGARVGQDGFGFAPSAKGAIKVPQLGRVVIGDGCEIGANTCIDRGSNQDTEIGAGTWLDNMVQIGHNVRIGKHCAIAAQVGIAGSTKIGNFVFIGGQAGISGHLEVGDFARIAAKSGVTRDVPVRAEVMGYPAQPMRQFLRGVAALNRLIQGGKSS